MLLSGAAWCCSDFLMLQRTTAALGPLWEAAVPKLFDTVEVPVVEGSGLE